MNGRCSWAPKQVRCLPLAEDLDAVNKICFGKVNLLGTMALGSDSKTPRDAMKMPESWDLKSKARI